MFGLLSKKPKQKQNESQESNRDSVSIVSTGTARSSSGHNLTKSISKATMALTGSGPPIYKQLKIAIMEGNEEKALALYVSRDGTKIPLDQPFPTKKQEANQDTPVHLAAKYALSRLLAIFIEYGGNPSLVNGRGETALHSVCLSATYPLKRAEMIEDILNWQLMRTDNFIERVDINGIDIDGNTALHLAAFQGMVQCLELLIRCGARLNLINNHNLSCCETADRNGNVAVGTMLELAWIFQPTNDLQLAVQTYNKFASEAIGGHIILDTKSIALTGLIDFINHAIRITAETLSETAARAEVLLVQYCWDVKKLKREYLLGTDRVLRASKLKVRPNAKKLGQAERETDTIRVGIPIEDVYCDPSYAKVSTFTILKDGVKKSYSLQTYDNKVCVFPTGFDPSLRYMDDFGANPQTSHVKPKKTEPCPMCNEMMLEPCSIIHFISGNIVEPFKREIRCSSGHKYCFNCWSDHAQSHISLGCLPCPAVDCGEILDLQWAPLVLKRSELVNRLLTNRQQAVIKSLDLKVCPAPNCGLLVRVLPHDAPKANRMMGAARTAICANGHAFCLTCAHEAHSPLHCSELTVWQELLRQESKGSSTAAVAAKQEKNSKDKTTTPVKTALLVSPPTSKRCPSCDAVITKDEACNVVSCLHCHKKLCWTCMKEWNTHGEGNTMYYCNQFLEKIPKRIGSGGYTSNGEEKVDDMAMVQKKQKLQRQHKILHYFTRFMIHMQSARLERDLRKHNCLRVLDGLRASQEGDLTWLRQASSANPLYEKVDEDFLLPSIGNKEDALIADYQITAEDSIEFIADAFDELERSRLVLKWSYPFALFELEEQRTVKGKKPNPNRTPQRLASFKVDFGLFQASLEYHTELLSNMVARKRMRGTKQEICIETITVRSKRIQFERLVQEYLTPPEVLAAEREALNPVTPVVVPITTGNPSEESKRSVTPTNLIMAPSYQSNSSLLSQTNNNTNTNALNSSNHSGIYNNQSSNQYNQSLATAARNPIPPPPPPAMPYTKIPEPYEIINVEQRIIGPKKDPDEEALEHAILLSKQEEEYGINMYDSLTPADEPLIADYMEQGFTREEAILIIYEEKFGKVSIQSKEITPSLPSTMKSGGYHPAQDDPAVQNLMTKGYTKEQAIEIVTKRNQRRNPTARMPPAPPAYVMNSLQSTTVVEEEAIKSLVASGYTREQAYTIYQESKRDPRYIPDETFRRSELLAANEVPMTNHNANVDSAAVAMWIARGYTREQAIHQVALESQQQARGGRVVSPSNHNVPVYPANHLSPSNSNNNHQAPPSGFNRMTSYDEDEIAAMMARGYSREQAMQFTHRKTTYDNTHHGEGFDSQVAHVYQNNNNSSIYRASSVNNNSEMINYSNHQPFARSGNNNHNSQQQVIYPSEHHFPSSPPPTTTSNNNQRGGYISSNNSSAGNTPTTPSHPNIFRAGGNHNPGGLGSGYNSHGLNPDMPNYSGSVYDTGSVMTHGLHSDYVMNPRQPMFDVQAMNQHNSHHYHTTSHRANEAVQMERTMLLMQQEAEFGINMYDSLTPADEPEINALIAQGYSYDDAVKMIFDRRYRPYDPKLQGMMTNPSGYYGPSDPVDHHHQQSQQLNNYPNMHQYSNDSNYSGYQEDKRYSYDRNDRNDYNSNRNSMGGAGNQKKKVLRGSQYLGLNNNNPNQVEEDPYSRTIRLSQETSNNHPSRANSMNYNKGGGANTRPKYKISDVKQLEKMGFSKEQAVQALMENDNDLHLAADMLLASR